MTSHFVTYVNGDYYGPGEYIAVCNNGNWDGHYIVRFTVPPECPPRLSAAWWFLNRLDSIACVDRVYPASLFGDGGR